MLFLDRATAIGVNAKMRMSQILIIDELLNSFLLLNFMSEAYLIRNYYSLIILIDPSELPSDSPRGPIR